MGSCFSRDHGENSHWLQLPTEQGPCTTFGHNIFLETIYQILQRVHKYFLFFLLSLQWHLQHNLRHAVELVFWNLHYCVMEVICILPDFSYTCCIFFSLLFLEKEHRWISAELHRLLIKYSSYWFSLKFRHFWKQAFWHPLRNTLNISFSYKPSK